MNKHTVVTGTTDYYSVMKRNRLVLVATLGRVSKVLCSVKEVSLQRLYTLHGSVNVAFSERQNAETTTDQWLPEAKEGGRERLQRNRMRKVTGAVKAFCVLLS